MIKIKYYDKEKANMLLGALYTSPALFDSPEIESLSEADFVDKVQKVSYSIMFNLFAIGHTKFSAAAIESYVKGRPSLNSFYNEEIELQNIGKVKQGEYFFETLAKKGDPSTFLPSFQMVKKMSLLRGLDLNGVSVSKYYDWEAKDPKLISFQRNWLEKTSIIDIANDISDDIAQIMSNTTNGTAMESFQVADGLSDLLSSFKEAPDFGMPSPIDIMDTITRGDRLGKFYLYSAPTGNGKSRIMMSRACHTAFGKLYNPKKRVWEDNGSSEPSLFISTELDKEECQTMALAYLTGINEEIILDGRFNEDDEKVLLEGIEIMKESPLYMEVIPDFSVQILESTIRKYHREKDVNYFRFVIEPV